MIDCLRGFDGALCSKVFSIVINWLILSLREFDSVLSGTW